MIEMCSKHLFEGIWYKVLVGEQLKPFAIGYIAVEHIELWLSYLFDTSNAQRANCALWEI